MRNKKGGWSLFLLLVPSLALGAEKIVEQRHRYIEAWVNYLEAPMFMVGGEAASNQVVSQGGLVEQSTNAAVGAMGTVMRFVPPALTVATRDPGSNPKLVSSHIPGAPCVGSVLFERGSDWIHPRTKERILTEIASCPETTAWVVEGFTCPLGNQDINDNLAAARAKAVAGVLTDAGYRVGRWSGKGKVEYVTTDPEQLNRNRRVEIIPDREEQ